MSVTTTANPTTTALQRTLADYEIHLTGAGSNVGTVAPQNSVERTVIENPPNWVQNRRNIPPMRPINHNLSAEERPNGMNALETTFLVTMFSGVSLVAGSAQLWRKTGGKLNDTFWKYQIGGEW